MFMICSIRNSVKRPMTPCDCVSQALCPTRLAGAPSQSGPPWLATRGHDYFESVQQVETHLEHVDIVIVVLDMQNSGHETPAGSFSG